MGLLRQRPVDELGDQRGDATGAREHAKGRGTYRLGETVDCESVEGVPPGRGARIERDGEEDDDLWCMKCVYGLSTVVVLKSAREAATGLTCGSILTAYRFTLLGRYFDEGKGKNTRGCQGHGRDQHALATHSLDQEG